MPWTMIKNNFKLMFRNKLTIVLAILGPILVIATLSSAFHDLLYSGYSKEGFTMGYNIDEGSPYAVCKEQMLKVLEEQGITCSEFPKEDPDTVLKAGRADLFLQLNREGSILYSQDIEGIKTNLCRYVLYQFDNGMKVQMLLKESAQPGQTGKVDLHISALPRIKTAEATDYYGIIENVYFIWISMVFLAAVVQSERKNRIQSRFLVSPASKLQLYMGKFIPCEMLSILCSAVSIVLSTVLFDIHWGSPWKSAGILLLTTLVASAVGILCLYMVKNLAVSVVCLFMGVWFAGFVGGSFETYMYSDWSEKAKLLSPFYHINRTLVEYSTMGQSKYAISCVWYFVGLLVVCVAAGLFLMSRRMEEK